MVYKLDGGKVIDDDNNLFVENLYVGELTTFTIERGETEGFTAGGLYSPPTVRYNTIDKFPFASDTNATDHGDLFYSITSGANHSTADHGYVQAGINPSLPSPYASENHIQRFPFASGTGSEDVGDVITGWTYDLTGCSSLSHGYAMGGNTPQFPEGGFYSNVVQKFQFGNSSNSVDVGNLTLGRSRSAGHTSDTHGYGSGGFTPPLTYTNVIDKFPFSTDADATDVGDLVLGRQYTHGNQSDAHGYTIGGLVPPNSTGVKNEIERFPFSSDGNASDVGDLASAMYDGCGQSSQTHGYLSGGRDPVYQNVIQKFLFSSSSNGTDVGDLTQARVACTGHQV